MEIKLRHCHNWWILYVQLFRANRTSKCSSVRLEAYDSPNCLPLVEVGVSIKVFPHRIFKPVHNAGPCVFHTEMSPDVSVLRIFPSITNATVKAFLAPPVKGNSSYIRVHYISICRCRLIVIWQWEHAFFSERSFGIVQRSLWPWLYHRELDAMLARRRQGDLWDGINSEKIWHTIGIWHDNRGGIE